MQDLALDARKVDRLVEGLDNAIVTSSSMHQSCQFEMYGHPGTHPCGREYLM